MFTNKSRLLSLILAALLTSSALLSCAAETDTITQDTTAVETVETAKETTELEARQAMPDNLPTDLDYEGYEFHILTYSPDSYEVEELSGDVVDDSIYDRSMDMLERFNVVIKASPVAGITELDAGLKSSVMAGDHAYDIAIPHQITSGPGFITGNYILPWNDVPYIDQTQPWWNQTINETITIMDKQYYIAGYITMPTPFCMFANRGLLLDYGYDDIYSFVKEGTWTFDKLSEITSKAYVDLNGNGEVDAADQFGLTFNDDNTTLNFMYAAGVYSVVMDENNKPVPNVFNDKMISLVDKLYNLTYTDNQTWLTTYTTQDAEGYSAFKEGRMLFVCTGVSGLETFREADIDLGIIPYPKWDESQEKYGTHVDAWNGMLCIPKTTAGEAVERTGVITEAMAAYTYKYVIPNYYDVALGTKYVRDTESREMLDIIFDSVVYDFGYIFDAWNGCTWILPRMITQKKTDVASYWKSIEKKVTKHYEDLYKAVAENK